MTRPNFLFIGPDKTGSSWLFRLLRGHPECYVPACKDIYFFDQNYGRGWDWYEKYFFDAPTTAKAIGELSHDYLFSRIAAERIAHDLPNAKLLTTLRDPVDRAFSQYLYLVRSGMTREPFERAVWKIPRLLDNSLYFKHLQVYWNIFGREQVKILFFEQLRKDAKGFAQEVVGFLGVEDAKVEGLQAAIRPAARPRSYLLAKMARIGATSVRALGFPGLVGKVKHSCVVDWLYRPFEREERPRPKPEQVRRLREYFEEDVAALEEMLGTDLSSWRAGE